MNLDRISACSASPLAGGNTKQAASHILQSQSNAEKLGAQSLSMGNRCAHNKNKLRVSPVYGARKSDRRRPHVIQESGNRLLYLARRVGSGLSREDIRQGRDKKSGVFQWFCALREDPRFLRFLYHIRDDQQPARKRRTEGLESALFITLATLVYGCNLHKMAYGYYDGNNQFHYFDYGKLANDSLQSDSRIKRSMSVLKDMELVKVNPIYETLPNGKIITTETRIEISDQVFDILGITKEFLSDREDANIKWQKRENELERKDRKSSLYKPRNPYERKHKVNKGVATGCQSLAQSMKPKYNSYNPFCDKQVIALAGELLASKLCANMRDALTLACAKLGKSPPS